MVPNGWDYKKLGAVAELQRGFDLPSSKRLEGSIPIISSGGVSGYHNEAKVKAPGIVTGRYGSIGDVFFVEEDFWPLNTSLWVKNFHGNEPKYLYYLLTSFDFKKFSDKTGVPGVNRNDLHAVKVGVPPLPEQRIIAKTLSTWDKAISTTEKLIETSKQQKKALMQQLLTGKKRLVNPETSTVFEGDWNSQPISSLITESRIAGTNGELARKLTVKLYGRGVTQKEEKRLGSSSTKYYRRKSGQFIYSKLDFLNGAFGIIPKHLDGFESTLDLPAFDFSEQVEPKWFIEFVSRDDFYTSNLGLANGGRKARRVNPKDLLQIKVQVPSLKEQQKIASVLTAADKDIEVFEAKLAHFKQEKKALMQQLLTGKRRVKIS
ncbi:restriction endonuclease subunit S [Vibrio cholerae]